MATNMYNFAVNHHEAAKLVKTNGNRITYIFEGEPGISKSSILSTLRAELGDAYDYIYLDVPTKDIPDIALSMPDHDTQTTKAYINSMWLGTDPKKPKIVMADEAFKGSDYVRLLINRLFLERVIGDFSLPEGSIVFGTTNFQSDGVGDRSSAHTNSRVARVPMRKPTQEEWLMWAADNDIHEIVMTWVNQNPALFKSYKDTEIDVRAHKDGQGLFHMIYHPQHNNIAYVCPRTLELASHQLHNIGALGDALVTKALIGTIGAKAALDMSALMAVGSDLPHPKDIEADPMLARIPKSSVGQMMLVYKSLQYLSETNVDKYATYFIERFPMEMISTWIKTIVGSNNVKEFALRNQQIKNFAIKNAWVL
jgi:hypothetical protein